MYMRNAVAAIVVYDITERKSFDDIDQWLKGSWLQDFLNLANNEI